MKPGRIILAALILSSVLAMNTRTAMAEDGFTTTTTHIQADLWSVMRIERPEPMAPRNAPVASTDDRQMASHSMNFLGIMLMDQYNDPKDRVASQHSAFFEVPFFYEMTTNRQGAINWRDFENMYWFALFDGVVEKQYDKRPEASYARLAVLDAPIVFTAYTMKFEAPKRLYWEVLDLPLVTTLSHETDTAQDSWKVLNIPFFSAYQSDKCGSVTTTRLLDARPFVNFIYSNREASKASWAFLETPVLTLAATQESVTGPTTSSVEYLKMPFLGPVFGAWTKDGGQGWGVFPALFLRSSCPESFKHWKL